MHHNHRQQKCGSRQRLEEDIYQASYTSGLLDEDCGTTKGSRVVLILFLTNAVPKHSCSYKQVLLLITPDSCSLPITLLQVRRPCWKSLERSRSNNKNRNDVLVVVVVVVAARAASNLCIKI